MAGSLRPIPILATGANREVQPRRMQLPEVSASEGAEREGGHTVALLQLRAEDLTDHRRDPCAFEGLTGKRFCRPHALRLRVMASPSRLFHSIHPS